MIKEKQKKIDENVCFLFSSSPSISDAIMYVDMYDVHKVPNYVEDEQSSNKALFFIFSIVFRRANKSRSKRMRKR